MRIYTALLAVLFLITPVAASEPIPIEELTPLSPFIGTWKTIGGSVDGSNNFEDVSKWHWAYGGKIVKIIHSVNKGAYYGESLISWDAQQKKIIYRYVNNAGFYTDGVITPKENGALSIHEMVRGALSGPTETLSEYLITGTGHLEAWSKFKSDGEWSEANTVRYERVPGASIIFKD